MIIVNDIWQKGKTIFDVVDDLLENGVILKGANAIDLTPPGCHPHRPSQGG